MDKRFWAAIVVIILIIIGAVWISDRNKPNTSSNSSSKPTSHIEGEGKSGVKLVEYGDYECPICGEYFQTVKQVASKYNTQIYFQFRNLPLTQIHQNAYVAARAAEAASLQGKYWQMHDMLYNNQNSWANSSSATTFFNQYATSIGLNLTQFKKDYASSKVNDAIQADLDAFSKTNEPEATPSFFLDGKFIDTTNLGVVDKSTGQLDVNATVANFSKYIDAEIKAKTDNK